MRDILALTLLLACAPALGQEVEREEFALIGWNDACSVAVSHYGYPYLGQAVVTEPTRTGIGTLTIDPGQEEPKAVWEINWNGAYTWKPFEAKKAVSDLVAAGYDQPGFPEPIRIDRAGAQPGLAETLLSTEPFKLRWTAGWPGPEWRLSQVQYSPLGTCGLFLFTDRTAPKPYYQYVLARIHRQAARSTRSRAHITNGLIMLEEGDVIGAESETAIAAGLTPQRAQARYHHAAMLCLLGRMEEAMSELAAAIKRDPGYKKTAREDRNFETLQSSRRFQELTR